MSKKSIIRNCDGCSKEDTIDCETGLCPSCLNPTKKPLLKFSWFGILDLIIAIIFTLKGFYSGSLNILAVGLIFIILGVFSFLNLK